MANETFSVGEIVVIQNASKPGFNGMEVTITGGLGCRYMRHVGPVFCYELSFHDADGLPYLARPHQIRKRRPPQDWVKLCQLDDLPREVTHV